MLGEINGRVKEKGSAFQALFYIALAMYFIPILISIGSSLLKFDVLRVLFASLWILAMVYLLKKNNFYEVLWLTLMFSPISIFFILLPMIQLFIPSSAALVYLLISGVALVSGIIYGLLFSKTSDTSSKFIMPSIFYSMIISFVFALAKIITSILESLGRQFSALSANAPAGLSTITTISQPISNPTIGFLLFMIFFNAPFIKYFLLREDRKNKYLVLYVIPIITFIIIYYSFVSLLPSSTIG